MLDIVEENRKSCTSSLISYGDASNVFEGLSSIVSFWSCQAVAVFEMTEFQQAGGKGD